MGLYSIVRPSTQCKQIKGPIYLTSQSSYKRLGLLPVNDAAMSGSGKLQTLTAPSETVLKRLRLLASASYWRFRRQL